MVSEVGSREHGDCDRVPPLRFRPLQVLVVCYARSR